MFMKTVHKDKTVLDVLGRDVMRHLVTPKIFVRVSRTYNPPYVMQILHKRMPSNHTDVWSAYDVKCMVPYA